MIVTYRQLFGYGWWGTLWRCIVTYLTFLMLILPPMLVAFRLSADDRKDTVMLAGPILLAITATLTAIMLFVTYYISRRKEKKIKDETDTDTR